MDINYLQDIIAELSLLDPSQHRQAEQLKTRTVEAFRQLFPNDITLIRLIRELRFDVFSQISRDYNVEAFLDSKNKLTSVISAKVEVLKHLPANKALQDIQQSNQQQASIIKQQELTIEQYKIELKKADEQLLIASRVRSEQETKIHSLEDEVKKPRLTGMIKNATFWTLVGSFMIGVPLWTFDRGKDFGYRQVDEERIQLKDSVEVRDKAIEYMRLSSDSAHQILGSMPYSEMKLDTGEYHKVQSTIERAGHLLYLNKNYRIK